MVRNTPSSTAPSVIASGSIRGRQPLFAGAAARPVALWFGLAHLLGVDLHHPLDDGSRVERDRDAHV
jgi:hypothetical protein